MNFYLNAYSKSNFIIDVIVIITFTLFLFVFLLDKRKFIFSKEWDLSFYKRILILTLIYLVLACAVPLILDVSSFIRVRIAWTVLTIAFPILGLVHFLFSKRISFLFLSIFLLCIKFYSEVWEPNFLDVEHIQIRSDKILSPIKIVHISDLQTDDIRDLHLEVREEANRFQPDLILFTGDVMNHASLYPIVTSYLKEFKSNNGFFFVTGDVDHILRYTDFSSKTGSVLWDRKSKVIQIGKNKIGLIGLGLPDYRNKTLIWNLRREIPEDIYSILISHYPDSVLHQPNEKVDLILAGHTHGGQVQVPFFGPILTLSRVPRHIAAGGLNSYENTDIIVSRGLGAEGHVAPRIRFGARPHLILLELLPANPTKETVKNGI
ncbi:metallophosphoesterase [Leptospira johnsonii]|uniref:Ser/Thr phosphatase family protein n=1 Tax=Leptospira johnsonii TaxID=1917820 RepID=A0A2P2D693_9LEPT|nr:metallophosphoesterase [Leptospira johnsonii]GBF40155.1 Ser/Thr phosphatase family protein [Leptospira johnsonii]